MSHALDCISGLQPGRSDARDLPPVEAFPVEHFEATLAFMPEVVADMCRVQLASGCRAGELVTMRTADIDQNGPQGVWVYRPATHKNKWRGHKRQIVLGPKAQRVLRRYLCPEVPEEFL